MSAMDGVMKRGEALVAEAQSARLSAWDAAISDALPGARIERDEDSLTVTGQDLLRQWLGDSRLRFLPGAKR